MFVVELEGNTYHWIIMKASWADGMESHQVAKRKGKERKLEDQTPETSSCSEHVGSILCSFFFERLQRHEETI